MSVYTVRHKAVMWIILLSTNIPPDMQSQLCINAVAQLYSLYNTRGNIKCIILVTFFYTCRHFQHTIKGNPYSICMPLCIRGPRGGWEEHWEQGWATEDDAVQVCRESRRGGWSTGGKQLTGNKAEPPWKTQMKYRNDTPMTLASCGSSSYAVRQL